ncbi:MAG TPA: glycoside hydrolase family 88 protein [Gemmatimonadales bacterium]|nr:glycoside hydrolase family 88 protein [Gemmatimonadales bacterium]
MHGGPVGRVAAAALLASLAAGSVALPARAQTKAETERAVRLVADGVLREATFDFVDSATGRRYASPDSAPSGARIRLGSPYNDWRYWNGVLNIAMGRLAGVTNDARYFAFSGRNITFAFDHSAWFAARYQGEDRWTYPFAHQFGMVELDDYGAEGAITTDLLLFVQDPRLRQYVERAASYGAPGGGQVRLPDGTLARNRPRRFTIWADDLFMSVPFLARQWGRTGERSWLDDAVRQVISYHHHLDDPITGLMYHNWYSDSTGGDGPGSSHGVALWGRANGWAMMAQAQLLDRAQPWLRARDTLLLLFRRQAAALALVQDGATGLWHQLLDKPDSYLETSASAMFVYAIARGVSQGWLPASYAAVARKGWRGVMSRIRADGQIEGTCAGTGTSDVIADYYARPTPLNDVHGVGPVLLAGAEVLDLSR